MKLLSVAIFGALAITAVGCSLGQGEGKVYTEHLYAKDCWGVETDPAARPAYDLKPDFFASNPFREEQLMRVQRGNDIEELSDGLDINLDNTEVLRSRLGRAELVGLTAQDGAKGRPLETSEPALLDEAPLVHMSLYLQYSCHNQGTILQAISGTITFAHLFDGNPDETVGAEKYTDATFDVQVGDPQMVPPGQPADAVPVDLQTHLTGYMKFYFERGQPGQPFP